MQGEGKGKGRIRERKMKREPGAEMEGERGKYSIRRVLSLEKIIDLTYSSLRHESRYSEPGRVLMHLCAVVACQELPSVFLLNDFNLHESILATYLQYVHYFVVPLPNP